MNAENEHRMKYGVHVFVQINGSVRAYKCSGEKNNAIEQKNTMAKKKTQQQRNIWK